MPEYDSKALSNARFSQFADRYVSSPVHAAVEELTRMIEIVQPRPDWVAMDIATGGGHTALAFAPYVKQMFVTDISEKMLAAAHQHITGKGAENGVYIANDAENLPYASNSFDLVLCRVAAHHFPDCFKFVRECQRVLKPGGTLLIHDHVQPESEKDAEYLEAFERLRDPSHNHAYSLTGWRNLYLDAGLTVDHTEIIKKTANFLDWAARQDCPPDVVARLTVMLAQAPKIARDWFEPACVGTPDATFKHVYILISGRKPV